MDVEVADRSSIGSQHGAFFDAIRIEDLARRHKDTEKMQHREENAMRGPVTELE